MKEKQIKELCKKHPQWKTLFLSYLDIDENISIKELEKTFSLIISHKSIFKNLIHDAKSFLELNDNRSVLERLTDKVTADVHRHKKYQFIKSLKTKKYKKLFNEEIEQEIHTILDNKIAIDSLKHQFFNKLAKYKNSNELLSSLQLFKNKNIQWNREYYEQLIKENNLNVEILDDQNGYMNIQVNDYKACKTLGSQAWCIVQEKRLFLNYTSYYKRQIISFNFNLPIENNESMIGFTLEINGEINDSYLKNDNKTLQEIKEKFKFKSLSKEKIENILKEKTNQDAFQIICQFRLIDFYDEYINKKDVNSSSRNNYAIRVASYNGYLDIVNRLLEDPRVDPSADNNYAIRFASYNGHFDVVNRLLTDTRVNASADNNYAIRFASYNGHFDVVNRLLEDPRVDPSARNNYAIRMTSYKNHLDIVNRLLEDPRVDPSDKSNESIRLASAKGHLGVVNRLLEDPRVDPSDVRNFAIRLGVKNGHLVVVNRLLEDPRVDPSAKNNFAIHWASRIGHLDIVNRLLEDPRVDPSVKNNFIKILVNKYNINPYTFACKFSIIIILFVIIYFHLILFGFFIF